MGLVCSWNSLEKITDAAEGLGAVASAGDVSVALGLVWVPQALGCATWRNQNWFKHQSLKKYNSDNSVTNF
jgi:hypothetical protein